MTTVDFEYQDQRMTAATSTTLRRAGFWLGLFSMLPHIFCCALPVLVALVSLGSTIGLGAALAGNPLYGFVDANHTLLLTLAVSSVAVTGLFNLIAWRIDCRKAKAACAHGDCAPKKKTGFKLFFISLALLAVDIAWFATEEHILGLHHHDAAAHGDAPTHGHDH